MTTNFPPRPNENSDPWYSDRETYDQALENAINSLEDGKMEVTRGVLPDGIDVDDLYSTSSAGTWRALSAYTYQNLPEAPEYPSILYVSAASSSVFQMYIGVGYFWWRFRSANVWDSWRKVVTQASLEDTVNDINESKLDITKGVLPDGSDADDLIGSENAGTWRLMGSDEHLNVPVHSPHPAILNVEVSSLSTTQIYVGVGEFWWRFRSSSVWGGWKQIPDQVAIDSINTSLNELSPTVSTNTQDISTLFRDTLKMQWNLEAGTNVDDLVSITDSGYYAVDDSIQGLPFQLTENQVSFRGVLEVLSTNFSHATLQRLTSHDQFWWREARIAGSGGSNLTWGDWIPVANKEVVDTLNDSVSTNTQDISTLFRDTLKFQWNLEPGTHVDDLTTITDSGYYAVDDSIEGLPFELTWAGVNFRGVLEVLRTNNQHANLQRITSHDQTWWREGRISGSEPDSLVWGPWTKVFSLSDVVVETNRRPFIEEGQVGAMLDSRHSSTFPAHNFDEFFARDVEEWGVYPTFKSWFEGGGGHVTYDQFTNRAFALWDRHGSFADGEVLVLANHTGTSNSEHSVGGCVLRASPEWDLGFVAGIRTPDDGVTREFSIARYNDVWSTSIADIPIEMNLGVPYFIRFRVEGDHLWAKLWSSEDEEPLEWTLDAISDYATEGYAGVGGFSYFGTSRYSYISVNRAGGRA